MKNFTLIFLLILGVFTSNAQNFWEQTNGPSGGEFQALAVNSNGDIFAGTVHNRQ